MEVLNLCFVQGVQTFNLGLPILAEELERQSSSQKAARQMANDIEVANLEQLPPGRGTTVSIEGKDIALFNVDGTVYEWTTPSSPGSVARNFEA